ncbi:hypothetical protein DFA_08991 [Cavenderia fasciculata]|uniref:Uncharacterized protein n=1 Tax=Cavenderia fasciculata TaxID=261658 RepID=F4Q6E3_CACFS|nr:uncharacterized protein DFA_08991 [Cavenderia fasciculata]EGG16453.1 hypothetical protein DFA_08991 [Cavenderia fasciculata]|eukprot:XP_004354853.1 hypothetical protein DFA_08991 [Cavenderia fasciculata]
MNMNMTTSIISKLTSLRSNDIVPSLKQFIPFVVDRFEKVPKMDKIILSTISGSLFCYYAYGVLVSDELPRFKREAQRIIDETHAFATLGEMPASGADVNELLEDFRVLSSALHNLSLVRAMATRANAIKLTQIIDVSFRSMAHITSCGLPLSELQVELYFESMMQDSRIADAFNILEEIILEIKLTKNIPIKEMIEIFQQIPSYPILVRLCYAFSSLIIYRPETIPLLMSCNVGNVMYLLIDGEKDNEFWDLRKAMFTVVSHYTNQEIIYHAREPVFQKSLLIAKKQINDGLVEALDFNRVLRRLDAPLSYAAGQWVYTTAVLFGAYIGVRNNPKSIGILIASNFIGYGIALTVPQFSASFMRNSHYKDFASRFMENENIGQQLTNSSFLQRNE